MDRDSAPQVRRQELEQLALEQMELERVEQRQHEPERSPLLEPEEAVQLLRNGKREIGVLSHAWLSPGDPDPAGARMSVVRHALQKCPHIKALFWDVRLRPPPFPLSRLCARIPASVRVPCVFPC
jgi:hypothetical protein